MAFVQRGLECTDKVGRNHRPQGAEDFALHIQRDGAGADNRGASGAERVYQPLTVCGDAAMMATYVLPIIFAFLVMQLVVGFYLHHSLLSQLKAKHADKWRELGSPTLIMNNSIKNNIAVLRFLIKREYLKLDDMELSKTSRLLLILDCIYIGTFFILIVNVLNQ